MKPHDQLQEARFQLRSAQNSLFEARCRMAKYLPGGEWEKRDSSSEADFIKMYECGVCMALDAVWRAQERVRRYDLLMGSLVDPYHHAVTRSTWAALIEEVFGS